MQLTDKILAIILIVVGSLFIYKIINPTVVVDKQYSIDTFYTKADTITLRDTVFIPKLLARIDTVYIDSEPVLVANADTTFEQDSSRIEISYYFPPENFFLVKMDIKEKIIEKTNTILTTQTITVDKPIYEETSFWGLIGLGILWILTK